MSFAKVLPAAFLVIATALIAVLFIRMRERDVRSSELQQTMLELQRQHEPLAARAVKDASAERSTGLYEAREHSAPGFRLMDFVYPNGRTLALYVSLVPDLILEDTAGAHLEDRGLVVQLTPAGQARLRGITRTRTTGGRVAREAIVLDGHVVAAPVFRAEIQTDTFVVGGPAAAPAVWTQRLLDEINAAQGRQSPPKSHDETSRPTSG